MRGVTKYLVDKGVVKTVSGKLWALSASFLIVLGSVGGALPLIFSQTATAAGPYSYNFDSYDGTSGTVPAGWSFNGITDYSSNSSCGAAGNCLDFNDNGDSATLTIPLTSGETAKDLSFYLAQHSAGDNANSTLVVEQFNGTTSLGSQSYTASVSSVNLNSLANKIVFTMSDPAPSSNNLALDDVVITTNAPATYNVASASELDNAIASLNTGDTINITSSFSIDHQATINKGNVTINGNGHTLTASDSFLNDSDTHGVLNITSSVTINSLTIDANHQTKHAINAFSASSGAPNIVNLNNVTAENGKNYGLVVNGTNLTVDNFSTLGNGYAGIDADRAADAASLTTLTINGTSHHGEFAAIYVDDGTDVVVNDINSQYFVLWHPTFHANDYVYQLKPVTDTTPPKLLGVKISNAVRRSARNYVTGIVQNRNTDPSLNGMLRVEVTMNEQRGVGTEVRLNGINGSPDNTEHYCQSATPWVHLYTQVPNSTPGEYTYSGYINLKEFQANAVGCHTLYDISHDTIHDTLVRVRLTDRAGNVNSTYYAQDSHGSAIQTDIDTPYNPSNYKLTIDNNAPTNVAVTSPANGTFVHSVNGKLVVTGTATDDVAMNRIGVQLIKPGVSGDIQYIYANNNHLYNTNPGTWSAEFDADALHLADGNYGLNIYAVDLIGNVKKISTFFTLDNTNPVLVVTPDASNGALHGAVTFNISASDINLDLSHLGNVPVTFWRGNDWAGRASGHVDLTSGNAQFTVDTTQFTDADGSNQSNGYELMIPAFSDKAGNWQVGGVGPNGVSKLNSYFRWYAIDNTAPTVEIDAYNGTDTTPLLTGTVNDPTADLAISIDGGAAQPVTNNGDGTWSYQVIAPLSDGSHSVSVVATDTAGNVSTPATASITVTTPTVSSPTNPGGTPPANTGGNPATPVVTLTPLTTGGPAAGTAGAPAGTPGVLGVQTTTPNNTGNNNSDSQKSDSGVQGVSTTKNDDNKSDQCFKILGICWYYWIPVIIVVAGVIYYGYKRYQKSQDSSSH